MQDFVNREPILSSSSNLEKQEKWLNKDRVWNFVFWFGMSFGFAIGSFCGTELYSPKLGNFIFLATFVLISLLVWFFNRTSLTPENKILNSEGKEITKDQLPYSWPFAVVGGIFLSYIILDNIFSLSSLELLLGIFAVNFLLFLMFTSGFSLYFIFKNCPIALLFSRHTWSMRTTGMFATPRESIELGTKLFNVVDNLDANLKSEPKDK